jgi:hypothetical protein
MNNSLKIGDKMRTWKLLNEANNDICEFTDDEIKHLLFYYDINFCQQILKNNKWEYTFVDGSFYCNIERYVGITC